MYAAPAMGKPSKGSVEERNLNKVRGTKLHKCKEPWVKAAQTA